MYIEPAGNIDVIQKTDAQIGHHSFGGHRRMVRGQGNLRLGNIFRNPDRERQTRLAAHGAGKFVSGQIVLPARQAVARDVTVVGIKVQTDFAVARNDIIRAIGAVPTTGPFPVHPAYHQTHR